MRLLLVTNDYPPTPGGIQQYLGNLVERYPGPVRVLAPRHPDAQPHDVVVRSQWRFMWPTAAVRRWVESQARSFEPDVIVFGAPHPLPSIGPSLRSRLEIPYGVIAHGAEVTIPAAIPGLRQLLAGPLRRADVVFTASRFTQRKVGSLVGREPLYLGIGVDAGAFHPSREPRSGPVVVGSVSRFVPRKGQADLLRALAALRDRGHPTEFLLVGRGRLESDLRRLAAELELAGRFEVAVPWERLPHLYREMNLFAVPVRSRWWGLEAEGLGIVFLEAGASGLPVVAGDSGGAAETIDPDVSGYLVRTQAELETALETLIVDETARRRMGGAARRFVEEHYLWSDVITRFVAGLDRVLDSRH